MTNRLIDRDLDSLSFGESTSRKEPCITDYETMLDSMLHVSTCGDPENFHTVYARKSGTYQPTLRQVIDEGEWKTACAPDQDQLSAFLREARLPNMTAPSFPARMVYSLTANAIIFCSPIPEDLSFDAWYAKIWRYCKATTAFDPAYHVIAALVSAIYIFRMPEQTKIFAEKMQLDANRFLSRQTLYAVSRLERDQTLDVFPF